MPATEFGLMFDRWVHFAARMAVRLVARRRDHQGVFSLPCLIELLRPLHPLPCPIAIESVLPPAILLGLIFGPLTLDLYFGFMPRPLRTRKPSWSQRRLARLADCLCLYPFGLD